MAPIFAGLPHRRVPKLLFSSTTMIPFTFILFGSRPTTSRRVATHLLTISHSCWRFPIWSCRSAPRGCSHIAEPFLSVQNLSFAPRSSYDELYRHGLHLQMPPCMFPYGVAFLASHRLEDCGGGPFAANGCRVPHTRLCVEEHPILPIFQGARLELLIEELHLPLGVSLPLVHLVHHSPSASGALAMIPGHRGPPPLLPSWMPQLGPAPKTPDGPARDPTAYPCNSDHPEQM